MPRTSWFSEEGDELIFQKYVERMSSWQQAMADGTITVEEAQEQAHKVAGLLGELEAKLDDETHELLTDALLEWAVLQGMQLTVALEGR